MSLQRYKDNEVLGGFSEDNPKVLCFKKVLGDPDAGHFVGA
jgi:hypothetical protein